MRRLQFAALCLLLTAPAVSLPAQTTPTIASTNMESKSVSQRYEASSEKWRLNTILLILKDDESLYTRTLKEMQDFTTVSRSYVIFKRKGDKEAKDIYYRNLENISKIEQLKQILDNYKKNFAGFNKDFVDTYKLDNRVFASFENFDKSYQVILDRWRKEFEAAMKDNNKTELRRIRQDMQLLRLAITAFILFPGKSATMVSQLQKMENDVRHAVVMVRMYEIETK